MLSRNAKVGVLCGGIAAGMIGLAYASVPLYRLFCQATGYSGTTQRVAEASHKVLDRTILVRFDGNVASGLDWDFAPVVNTMQVKVGENMLAVFKATNRSSKPVVGTATFNVTPEQAGGFFNKVQCFCFTEQRLDPGETAELPVSFFIDPSIVDDADGALINQITLSYTFYPVAKPKTTAVAPQAVPADPAVPGKSTPKG
ncbi:MAG: cytochrome c oxidase assembly protein [Proteobacteria bacterium]|nr:cytochrome c oxidase assembly protein [Pseudomonadota bacterium]